MSIEIETLEKLLSLMEEHEIHELEVEQEGLKVRLKKGGVVVQSTPEIPVAPAAGAQAGGGQAAKPTEAPETEEGLIEIRSPMVGTFYRRPNPDSDPYVQVGDQVSEDSVLCIIEAMKVMNEIKAETTGEIAKICAQNGEPVEYDQLIFLVRPN